MTTFYVYYDVKEFRKHSSSRVFLLPAHTQALATPAVSSLEAWANMPRWCLSKQARCVFLGPRKKSLVHWLWPEYSDREDLRWSPEVHPEDHLWPGGPPLPLAPQQWAGGCQRLLFLQWALGWPSARGHEREDRHRQARPDRVPHVCWRESVELFLPWQGGWMCCPPSLIWG